MAMTTIQKVSGRECQNTLQYSIIIMLSGVTGRRQWSFLEYDKAHGMGRIASIGSQTFHLEEYTCRFVIVTFVALQ